MKVPPISRRGSRSTIFALTFALVVVPALPAAAAEFGTPVEYDLVFPVDGDHTFSDTFWGARWHGVHSSQDIFAAKGVPVVAAADGVVRLVNWTSQSHMNPERCCSVVLDHNDGWQTSYLHLDNDSPGTDDGTAWGIAPGIVPGVPVRAGQLLGWVGDSQRAEETPPHLHFELRDPAGTLVNAYPALVAAGGHATGSLEDPALFGRYVIEEGDSGLHVRRLQELFAALDYTIAVDGDFGPQTQKVVVGFQEGAGLEPDGKVGRLTKQVLAAAYAEVATPTPESTLASTLRRGSRGLAVEVVQEYLDREGYTPGPIDGIFGPMTEQAVLAFQEARTLIIDGIVGPQTRRALGMQ
jgi:peptidoglycan hydrolase-like protein with peptidoglycan-binding domain